MWKSRSAIAGEEIKTDLFTIAIGMASELERQTPFFHLSQYWPRCISIHEHWQKKSRTNRILLILFRIDRSNLSTCIPIRYRASQSSILLSHVARTFETDFCRIFLAPSSFCFTVQDGSLYVMLCLCALLVPSSFSLPLTHVMFTLLFLYSFPSCHLSPKPWREGGEKCGVQCTMQ